MSEVTALRLAMAERVRYAALCKAFKFKIVYPIRPHPIGQPFP